MNGIEIKGLRKFYGNNEVLKKLDMNIKKPGVYLVAGPNGSGKTTLLEILVGLRGRDGGSVSIGEMDPSSMKVKRHVCFLAQQNSLRKNSTVKEEVQLVKDLFSVEINIKDYLDKYNLNDYLRKKTKYLSGGTKRRLLIAMTLMPQCDIVILDEPASGLDTGTRDEIWNTVRDYSRHKIVLVSDHYLNEAAQYSDYVYLINKGTMILEGETKKILNDFEMKYVIKTRSNLVETVKNKIEDLSDDYEVRISGTVCNIYIKSDSKRVGQLLGETKREFNIHEINLEDVYFYFTGKMIRDEVNSLA